MTVRAERASTAPRRYAEIGGRAVTGGRWIVYNGLAVWLFVVALAAVIVVRHGGSFLSEQNIVNLLSQSVILGLVAFGQTFVIIGGGIDLSVGSLASLTTVLAAGMIDGRSLYVVPVLLLMLALGGGVGVAHGYFVTRAGIAPFIVTLATYFILQGLGFAYTTIPVGSMPVGVSNFFFSQIGPVPWIFVILVVIGFLLAATLARTTFGRHLYAVGGNATIARSTGINVARVTTASYVISGVLAALAGFLLAARAGLGAPSAGSGLELSAIATVVLGGASLAGGRGRLLGTAGGVALLSLIQNAFTQLSISSYYQTLVLGAVIVAAVAIFIRRD
jgi:ribose transport system permease protein